MSNLTTDVMRKMVDMITLAVADAALITLEDRRGVGDELARIRELDPVAWDELRMTMGRAIFLVIDKMRDKS